MKLWRRIIVKDHRQTKKPFWKRLVCLILKSFFFSLRGQQLSELPSVTIHDKQKTESTIWLPVKLYVICVKYVQCALWKWWRKINEVCNDFLSCSLLILSLKKTNISHYNQLFVFIHYFSLYPLKQKQLQIMLMKQDWNQKGEKYFFCVCVFFYVCVSALVPAVRSGAAQEGSCSPRPSLTTPETPSAARRRKDCAVDTKHTNTHTEFIMIQTLSHTHTLVVMSQSAVSLSFHKSPDTKR